PVRLSGDASDPIGHSGLLHERVRGERFEKSLQVVINGVLFSSSSQRPDDSVQRSAEELSGPGALNLRPLGVHVRPCEGWLIRGS
ncbi:hypothetical protein, partial [Streptomyces chartreusis]|uniref:hypothetical protein n=1 Tax=Streptomyces chartreusis TaxID=1969 RepID=UPI0036479571